MRTLLAIAIASATLAVSAPAFASPYCNVSQSNRMSVDQIRAKAEGMGYSVRKVEVDDDGCYEAYAKDSKGQRVEVYMDPATGAVLQVKIDD